MQLPANRGNPQTVEIRTTTSKTFGGFNDSEDLDTVLNTTDSDLGRAYQDRNVILAGGGTILFTGTTVTFTEDLELHVNQVSTGTAPVVINLGQATQGVSADGRMIYAIIDRGAGTGSLFNNVSQLPGTNTDKEVFLIAKRVDSTTEGARLYFMNGMALNSGDEALLGSAGGGAGGYARIFMNM